MMKLEISVQDKVYHKQLYDYTLLYRLFMAGNQTKAMSFPVVLRLISQGYDSRGIIFNLFRRCRRSHTHTHCLSRYFLSKK